MHEPFRVHPTGRIRIDARCGPPVIGIPCTIPESIDPTAVCAPDGV